MGDNHDECLNPDTCLCAEDNHGYREPSLKDGVRVDPNPPSPEEMIYEKARADKEKLDAMFDTGLGDNSAEYQIPQMVRLMVTSGHIISKLKIHDALIKWAKVYGVIAEFKALIDVAWADPDVFNAVKEISYNVGLRKEEVMFDEKQLTEAAQYLMGRYHIKRIELNGNLLFFNDKYYEKNAEALIRRNARKILIKSTNGNIKEVLGLIEDSCDIITWKDIEDHVHLKCLLNGIYDIKRGVFEDRFNPDYIILNQIPHEFNEMATFGKLDKVVSEIIEDERDRMSFYDSLSTALHPYTGIDFQFGGVGQPGTGKSQLCFLASMVLGSDNVTDAPIHRIASDLTTQKDVAFAFLNIDQDMSDEAIQNIDVLKRWITQDKFTARGIYEHNTTFRPMARMMFMANNLYEIGSVDDAEAIYERTHVIRIEKKFRNTSNQTKAIMEKTASESELSGLVTFLLKNATWVWENQNIHYPINIQTVRDTWNLHGNRIKEFFETRCEKGAHREDQNDVWNAWISFANKKNYPLKDKKKFHEIFDEVVGNTPTKTRIGTGEDSRQVWAYAGFRILEEKEIASRETTPFASNLIQELGNFFGAFCEGSSKSSVLSLLKSVENSDFGDMYKDKFMELLELVEKEKKN